MAEIAECTIRNQRYQPWPSVAISMAQVVPIMAGLFWLLGHAALVWQLVYWPVVALVFGAATWHLQKSPLMHPVKVLRLGEKLKALPLGYRLPPRDIKFIEFAPDPAEDYVDVTGPGRACEVTVTVHEHLRFRLVIDMEDAARMNDWATANRIPIGPSLATLTRTARDE